MLLLVLQQHVDDVYQWEIGEICEKQYELVCV